MIHYGIPDAEYRLWSGYSQSFLKTVVLKSPAHAMTEKENKRDTDAMLEGRAFHTMLLERDLFAERYYVARKVVRKCGTSKDKKTGEVKKLAWDHVLDRAKGKDVLFREQITSLNSMRKSIYKHPLASALLSMDYQTEVSMKWTDADTGLTCKGRADILIPGERVIIDPKRTADASKEGFSRNAVNMGYAIQAAYYSDAMELLTGEPWLFLFLAVEPKPPYAVGLYELDPSSLQEGRDMYKQGLSLCKMCNNSNRWHAYSDKIETLSLPSWNERKASATAEQLETEDNYYE